MNYGWLVKENIAAKGKKYIFGATMKKKTEFRLLVMRKIEKNNYQMNSSQW